MNYPKKCGFIRRIPTGWSSRFGVFRVFCGQLPCPKFPQVPLRGNTRQYPAIRGRRSISLPSRMRDRLTVRLLPRIQFSCRIKPLKKGRAWHFRARRPFALSAACPHAAIRCPCAGHFFSPFSARRKKFIRSQAVPSGLMRTEAVRPASPVRRFSRPVPGCQSERTPMPILVCQRTCKAIPHSGTADSTAPRQKRAAAQIPWGILLPCTNDPDFTSNSRLVNFIS